MTNTRGTTAGQVRVLGASSAIYGLLLVAAPRAVAAAVGGTAPAPVITRVLGARQVGQGLALLLRPVSSTAAASAAVDGLHAVTMVAAALRWPAQRRAAVASGAVALASGVLAALAAR